jgi:hypothetical protein
MAKDILRDEQGDLLIKNGDFVIGPSEEQEIATIMTRFPGHTRSSPVIGFGYIKRIKGAESAEKIKADLDTHLKLDGFVKVSIVSKDGKIEDVKGSRDE